MTKITFYIARHGKTLMNTLDKVQGWCDSPLTKEGIDAARYLGYGLDDVEFRMAYCSDLHRTRQTAQIVLGAKGQGDIPIVELAGLREACFGSFEAGENQIMWAATANALGYDSPDSMYADTLAGKISYGSMLDVIKEMDTMDMAENYEQVEARTQETLREIAVNQAQIGEGNVLIVSHAVSIFCMLVSLGGDKLSVSLIENASVCKVIYEHGKFTIESMGDLSYLKKGRNK